MGTVTPDAFMKDMMADFAKHGPDYIRATGNTRSAQALARIREVKQSDLTPEQIVQDAMSVFAARDFANPLFNTYLDISGAVNSEGYRTGRLVTPFYDDVHPAFAGWKQNGKGIWVYSNGSEESQREMFRSGSNKLTPFVSEFLDTQKWGDKGKPDSYKKIAEHLQEDPRNIAFFSDLTRELDPASQVGYNAFLVSRPGNRPQPENSYKTIKSLLEAQV